MLLQTKYFCCNRLLGDTASTLQIQFKEQYILLGQQNSIVASVYF